MLAPTLPLALARCTGCRTQPANHKAHGWHLGRTYMDSSKEISSMLVFLVTWDAPTSGHTSGSSLGESDKGGLSLDGKVQLVAFCVFEGCIGVFWPIMMTLRARYVPEDMRSTIINIFRIPLNLFVCIILFEVSPCRVTTQSMQSRPRGMQCGRDVLCHSP